MQEKSHGKEEGRIEAEGPGQEKNRGKEDGSSQEKGCTKEDCDTEKGAGKKSCQKEISTAGLTDYPVVLPAPVAGGVDVMCGALGTDVRGDRYRPATSSRVHPGTLV